MSRWRDLLQPERSTDRHRELARPLQHQAAALCTWLSTTRTTGDQTTARPDAHHELTSHSAWYKISVRPRTPRTAPGTKAATQSKCCPHRAKPEDLFGSINQILKPRVAKQPCGRRLHTPSAAGNTGWIPILHPIAGPSLQETLFRLRQVLRRRPREGIDGRKGLLSSGSRH